MSSSLDLSARARQLQQLVQGYTQALGQGQPDDKAALRESLDELYALSDRLQRHTLRVAVFGLVSRGKSAVINALVGQKILDTGALHGVTRWPRSVYWQPTLESPHGKGIQPTDWQVEFIDTPGLDEIDGQARSEMAQTVAEQADLILFVVAGAITEPEADALHRLRDCQKPLLLVFNKTDLYPNLDRGAIAAQLRPNSRASVVDEIVWIAADPAPVQVRTEWPDGRTTTEWEAATPQIDDLRQVLKKILSQDAAALIALNTLRQARLTEADVVHQVSELRQPQAEALIWRFAQYKALAVALNPFALLDLLGGIASDLVMIRSLARLYEFPITSYQASKLWGSILRSSGLLLLSELGSLVLGAGKTTAALLGLSGSPASFSAVAGAMVAQASAAGYGTYVVGKAARTYLEQGCTWGPQGISAIMAQVIQETDTSETLSRLKQTIRDSLSGADLPT